jgi:BNR/Asp-box repeat
MQPQIFVGTTKGLYTVGSPQPVQFTGKPVRALAQQDAGWWAIINEREVWHADAGGSWRPVAAITSLRANCLLATARGLLLGTSDAHLFCLRGQSFEPMRAFDAVPGRADWHNPDGSPADVRSMAADPSGTVYVNVHVGGILRSADGGQSWTPTIDVQADVHQVAYASDPGLVLAAAARGLAVSHDHGKTWQLETAGLHGRYLRAVAAAGETVLVTASTGPFTRQAAVYRKPLEKSDPFERCREGLPEWFSDNIDTLCLAASGSWVTFGTATGDVFLSADEGQHWENVAKELPPVRCVAFA